MLATDWDGYDEPVTWHAKVPFSDCFTFEFAQPEEPESVFYVRYDQDFCHVSGSGLQKAIITPRTAKVSGEDMTYRLSTYVGVQSFIYVTGDSERLILYEKSGDMIYVASHDAAFSVTLVCRDKVMDETVSFAAGETCIIRITDGVPAFYIP